MGNDIHHSNDTHSHPGLGTRRTFLSSLISAAVFSRWTIGRQDNGGQDAAADMAERFRQMSEDYERQGLAEPFKGITTDGTVAPGLFQIAPSGVSTEPVRNAALRFISALSNVQLARTLYPVDDIEWRKWMNQHFYLRQGISLGEMTSAQRDAAFGLMQASLQRQGF